MRKLFLSFLMVLLATTAFALPINDRLAPLNPGDGDGDELSVQEILDEVVGVGSLDAVADQSKVALWNPSDFAQNAFKVTYLTGAYPGVFGIYSAITGEMQTLFSKPSGTYDDWSTDTFTAYQAAGFSFIGDALYINNVLVSSDFGNTFGFYWSSDGTVGKTEDSENPGDAIFALTYQLPEGLDVTLPVGPSGTTDDNNDWLMFFGDQGSLAGDDFNDFAVLVQDIAPVPEPGTLLLLGGGLVGLAYLRKRKKA